MSGMLHATVDFLDAYERHREDAEMLYQNDRWANADHLFGLSAECGLKAVMLALGKLRLRPSGVPIDKPHKVHIDKFWNVFVSLTSDPQAARYATMLSHKNPFSEWDINQRYMREASFIRPEILAAHRAGVAEVTRVVAAARRDGILR